MGILDELITKEGAPDDAQTVETDLEEKRQDPETQTEESDEEHSELVVTFGDAESVTSEEQEDGEPEKAPSWVRELRKNHKEQMRENRRLRQELEAAKGGVERVPELGPKPTLESADFDSEKFEMALDSWKERKRKHDALVEEQESAAKRQQEEWQGQLEGYAAKKREMKARDFDEAEMAVEAALNRTQQGLILQGAENSAKVIYSLGKTPAKLKALAEIKDPVKFAFAVAKLETQLRVTERRPGTAPEKVFNAVGKKTFAADKYDVGGTFE